MDKKAIIKYYLSEKGRKDSILKGMDGLEEQFITAEIDDRLLDLCSVSTSGQVELVVGGKSVITDYEIWEGHRKIYPITTQQYFDKIMTAEELIEWEEQRKNNLLIKYKELEVDLERIVIEQEKIKEEKMIKEEKQRLKDEKRWREERERIKERDLKEKEKKDKYENEKKEWININGSQYLKDAIKLGYDIDKKYIEERGKVEFPNYILDYEKDTYFRVGISCPDEKLLKEVKRLVSNGIYAEIVRITVDYDDYCQYEYDEDGYDEDDETLTLETICIKYMNDTYLFKNK